MSENKQEVVPKKWKVLAKFSSFEEASDKKKLILQNSDNVLVKIRRRADDTFDVKGYTVPKESTAKKKSKKSRKKSSKSKD
jgi:hypothetical protein